MRASLATRHRREYARAIVVLVSGLLIWVATGLGANADSPNKLFTATVTSPSMVAGGTYNQPSGSASFAHVVITFTNLYPSAPIQAIQVGVPQGITVLGTPTAAWDATSETPTVFTAGYRLMEFDNVSITTTQSLTVTIDAVAECFPNAGDYTWTARAKQANSFSGDPGNDFNPTGPTTSTISGSCSLKFDAQPKDAIKNTNITSKPLDPTPPGVKVGVYDGSGSSHVTWWETNISLASLNVVSTTAALSGYTSASPGSTGIAEFIHNIGTAASPLWAGPTLATSAAGYTLRATTSLLATTAFSHNNLGNLTVDSDPLGFVIVDDGQICGDGQPCHGHSSNAKLDALVQSTSGGPGELLVSLSPATLITLNCSGYTETTDVVDFNVTAANRSKTVTVTIYGGLVTKSANKWQACYRAPYSFQQLDGTMTAIGPDGFSFGLLPDCSKTTPAAGTPPCISARLPNSKTKDMVMVIAARPGDPKLNF